MSENQRKYATVQHPTIEALVHGLYKYIDRKDALSRLENIRGNFVMSKDGAPGSKADPAATFWIKGYGLTADEQEHGFLGHFCRMEIGTNSKGQFTLNASKVEVPLAKHPQKKRPSAKHPNWGHPVMRAIKKGKNYPTLEAAAAELELLHLEFPEVSIPGVNKLYLIIYEKREGVKQPTRKVALELTAKDAGFTILCKDNEKSAKAPTSKQQPVASGEKSEAQVLAEHNIARLPPGQKTSSQQPVGGFSAQELLRKKKRAMKRKKSDPRISKKIADNPHEQ